MRLYYIFVIILLSACQNSGQKSGQKIFQEVDGLNLSYSQRGDGPDLVASHVVSGSVVYENSLRSLEDQFKITYFNPRGVADSDPPSNVSAYRDEYLLREMEGFRKAAGLGKIWMFAHSDHSYFALQYCLDYPESCAGLILSGTSLYENSNGRLHLRKMAENERRNKSAWFDQVCKDLDYKAANPKATKTPDGRELKYTPLKWWCYDSLSTNKVVPILEAVETAGKRKRVNGRMVPYNTPGSQRDYDRRINNYQDQLGKLKIPVLILQGEFDTNNPIVAAKQLQERIPNCQLEIISKAGHYPWIENPEEFFVKLDTWLEKL